MDVGNNTVNTTKREETAKHMDELVQGNNRNNANQIDAMSVTGKVKAKHITINININSNSNINININSNSNATLPPRVHQMRWYQSYPFTKAMMVVAMPVEPILLLQPRKVESNLRREENF